MGTGRVILEITGQLFVPILHGSHHVVRFFVTPGMLSQRKRYLKSSKLWSLLRQASSREDEMNGSSSLCWG